MSESSETAARQALVAQYRRLGALRLNELASGNVSCRFGDGMLISPTGASAETITEDSVVFAGLDGAWTGDHKPSSEWMMHAALYRNDAKTGAVVHTHSDYCVAASCHNRALPGFHYLIGLFGGPDVPCVPYSTFGSAALAAAAAAALEDRTACLLANHGMISRGADLESAMKTAQRLEIMCRQYVLSRQLGEPAALTPSDWDDFFAQIRRVRYG